MNPTAGAANTGSGGGGQGGNKSTTPGGAGGSGIVIIRYEGASAGTGGTITTDAGDTIHTFTTTGNSSFNLSGLDLNTRLGLTLSSAITGTGSFTFDGPGRLTLSAVNTFSGETIISAGTLQVGDGSTSGTLGVGAVVNNSSLVFDRSNGVAAANAISGSGSLTQAGAGTLTLSGNNTYSGGTTVAAGRLVGDTASLQGAIANSATVEFNQAGAGTYAGVLSGSGEVVKSGEGVVTLGNTNTYTGTTRVAGGGLLVSGAIANSAVTVESGGFLGGSGTVGSLLVESGGTISPGNSPGTLNINGDIDWLGGGNYNWQVLNTIGTPGTEWDLISATGTLDLSALTASSQFNINLWSLESTGPDVDGSIANFDPSATYTWTILSAQGGIIGFAADSFAINTGAINGTAGFANALAPGYGFSMEQDGNNLNLVYAQQIGPEPIPEPGTWAAAALLVGGAALLRWRRRRDAAQKEAA